MCESPSELRRVPLGQLADIDPEVLPESTMPHFAFKYVDIASVSTGRIDLPSQTTAFADAPSRARMKLRSGDVLMSTVRPNLKAFAHCRFDDDNVVASTGFAVIRARENADPYFLLCSILSSDVSAQIERVAVGSNYPAINVRDVHRLLLPKFAADEQRSIGGVLRGLDNVIEATEALIEKHRKIKAGLMHDSLTRGILPNGQLRPARLDAPHLYRQTALGWIPRDWEVDKLSERVEVVDPNPSHRYPEPTDDGVALISTENFEGEDDIRIGNASRVPLRTFLAQNARCRFSPMDVVFARKGQIGLARRYGQEDKTFSHTVVIMKPIRQACDAAWLLWAARSAWLLNHIDRTMNSNSGVPTLGVAFIKAVPLPFPPAAEQQQIARVLDAATERISSLAADLCKLRAQKLGLMQDLLTGKVRAPLAEPVPA
jgi:type I restriction enzyme S subunit